MRKLPFVLLIPSLALFLTACSSVDESRRMERTAPVVVSVLADDAVIAGSMSPDIARNFGKNISKQLVSGLEDRGITCESDAIQKANKATVKVDLNGLQRESIFDTGPFGASTKDVFMVSYTATLISADGARLFRFDGREKSRVLDELPAEIGRYVAKRVANHYRAGK